MKVDVSAIALDIGREVDRLWPRETPFGRGLALAEEAGEVCRAMLKRDHAEAAGTFKGKTPEELLDIARREDFDVDLGLAEVVWKLKGREA